MSANNFSRLQTQLSRSLGPMRELHPPVAAGWAPSPQGTPSAPETSTQAPFFYQACPRAKEMGAGEKKNFKASRPFCSQFQAATADFFKSAGFLDIQVPRDWRGELDAPRDARFRRHALERRSPSDRLRQAAGPEICWQNHPGRAFSRLRPHFGTVWYQKPALARDLG